MTKRLTLAALLASIALAPTPSRAQNPVAPGYGISHISLAEAACSKTDRALGRYDHYDILLCQRHRVFGVGIAIHDAYSWPVLYQTDSKKLWDLQALTMAALPQGTSFPGLPANALMELLDFADGRIGIIFRIQGVQAEQGNAVSRLLSLQYVRGNLYYCGSDVTNQQARSRLVEHGKCQQRIEPQTI
ncbi:hypothetical protein [Chitinilyticum litopenaei]|uniref:hypothetical protein n=1 Tax=Chitinilyticum litopenaei TaxID=1121276 RepID=UPI00048A514F|nr:hypothetical protein [Chitinilyticum litopenaei]